MAFVPKPKPILAVEITNAMGMDNLSSEQLVWNSMSRSSRESFETRRIQDYVNALKRIYIDYDLRTLEVSGYQTPYKPIDVFYTDQVWNNTGLIIVDKKKQDEDIKKMQDQVSISESLMKSYVDGDKEKRKNGIYGYYSELIPALDIKLNKEKVKLNWKKGFYKLLSTAKIVQTKASEEKRFEKLVAEEKAKTVEDTPISTAKKPKSEFIKETEDTTDSSFISDIIPSVPEVYADSTVPESATIGASNITENSVFLFWNPHKDGGSPITSYHLLIKDEFGQTKYEFNPSYNTTSMIVSPLDSSTNYKAYIIVINAVGNSTENSTAFKTKGIDQTFPPPDDIVPPDDLPVVPSDDPPVENSLLAKVMGITALLGTLALLGSKGR